MVEDCNVPFKFKRKSKYQNLKGARVNMTYYPTQETVAGLDLDIMKVVRIKRGWSRIKGDAALFITNRARYTTIIYCVTSIGANLDWQINIQKRNLNLIKITPK